MEWRFIERNSLRFIGQNGFGGNVSIPAEVLTYGKYFQGVVLPTRDSKAEVLTLPLEVLYA
ncbi:hypothetical protein BVC80_335g10 [Macleaya cordata]|uniref:Uncharacterized protein n=1 Tax=Macleaya cordata TaxID=56857 RepID=A0A200QC89_MACCD|nr:hypothetical protein BVC80_335g10 [Macleaya cordata]